MKGISPIELLELPEGEDDNPEREVLS